MSRFDATILDAYLPRARLQADARATRFRQPGWGQTVNRSAWNISRLDATILHMHLSRARLQTDARATRFDQPSWH